MEGHKKHTSIFVVHRCERGWHGAYGVLVPMQRYRSIVKGQCSYRLLEVVETLMDLDGLAGEWIK